MSEPSHRRDFVRGLVLGSAAAGLCSRATGEDEPKKAAVVPIAEIEARMDLILARYGDFLDEAARKVVKLDVESIVRRADALRAFELTNADEPFPIFVPYRSPLG